MAATYAVPLQVGVYMSKRSCRTDYIVSCNCGEGEKLREFAFQSIRFIWNIKSTLKEAPVPASDTDHATDER